MQKKLTYLFDKIYRVLRVICHYILALIYGFHGKKVPAVKDPLLLLSATELAKRIREGTLSSASVVETYIDRILQVEPFINATIDRRFKEALEEANEADALVASGKMTVEQLKEEKPLLGIPFSVKVLLTVKGLRSTAGSLLFKDVYAQEDATAVTLMKKAGAIVLVTTNCSEVGLNLQSSNHIHGTTRNPYSTSRTSGGSSGGESALLAAAGSVIGLGNDMGGSIRIPCMFTGLFGHKPSRGLVSNVGCFPCPNEKIQRLLSTGPMCRYAQDLVTTMNVLSPPVDTKFGQKVNFKSLKVHYLLTFGENLPFVENVDSSMKDAVMKVVSYFEKEGSSIEKITIPLFKKSNSIYFHNLLSSIPNIGAVITAGKAKLNGLLELAKFLCFQSKFTVGYVVSLNAKRIPLLYNSDMVDVYKKLEDKLGDQLNNILDENSILVMPTIPFPAPYNNEISLLIGSACYSGIFNVLGLPSTQCPIGLNKQGLPVGIQVISRQDNDALTISCALEIEKVFGGWKEPK